MANKTIGVKVDEQTRQRLRDLADAKRRTPHWLVKEAIAEYLTREERVERERHEDEGRWERYVLTDEAVPHERVRDWLGALAGGRDEPCPR
jgi:predicted transcriptional regulator